MKIALTYGARSDQGRVRTSNQDSAYAGPHLLVIADGMGGPAGGDIASTLAVHQLRTLDDDSFLMTAMRDELVQAVLAAHARIVQASREDPALEGLGTTCTALIRSNEGFVLGHIGDSRAYRLRDGHLEQKTTDHSFVQFLVEKGDLTPEQAATHPQRSVLLKVLGDTQDHIEFDTESVTAEVGDRWLLCSDGLSGVIQHSELQRILTEYADPDRACEKLIEAALAGGGPDNITCVVADVVDEDVTQNIETTPITVGAAALADERGEKRPVTQDLPTAEIPTHLDADPLTPEATMPLPTSQPTPVEASTPRKRGRIVRALLATLLILGLLAFAGYRGIVYMRQGWTLALEHDRVVLYEGTPSTLGPFPLYNQREVLTDYTVTPNQADCPKLETSHDPSIFANPTAKRVLTCAAARTLAPSLAQSTEKAAREWLTRNSVPITVNTTEPSSQAPADASAHPTEDTSETPAEDAS